MYVCVKQVIAFFSSKLEKKGPSPYSSAFVLETIEEASKSWPGARLRVCVVCVCVCVCECIGGVAKKHMQMNVVAISSYSVPNSKRQSILPSSLSSATSFAYEPPFLIINVIP